MSDVTAGRIKNLIAKFVLKYNYWGYLFSRIRRKPISYAILKSIMGVAPETDGTVTLYYCPELVDATDDKHLTTIIEHEGMHLLNKHISRALRVISNEVMMGRMKMKAEIWNVSADCCVNMQANIKEPVIINGEPWPPQLPARYQLPDDKLTEWYYFELLKRADKAAKNRKQMKCPILEGLKGNGKGGQKDSDEDGKGEPGGKGKGKSKSKDKSEGEGSGGNPCDSCPVHEDGECSGIEPGKGGFDNHDVWRENVKSVADLSSLSRKVDSYVQDIIKDSVKNFNRDRGTIPGHIAQLIQSALDPPKAPYYQIIRKLVRASRLSKFKRSHTKINRKRTYVFRLGEKGFENLPKISPFPGRTRDFSFFIVIIIDTSGSMNEGDIKEGLSGIKNVIENDKHTKVIVLEVDTAVEKEYEVKKVRDIQFKVKGRGGTTLYPGLKRARELQPDVVLAFTDGGTENINQISRKKLPRKIIWVVQKETLGGTARQLNETGFVVRI
jgi:predicted metal-dependent peptidase